MKDLTRFTIHIDRDITVPAYLQLTEQITELIQSDIIRIGESLPPETVICELSGLSRMTVRKAMERLNKHGLVVAERGRGTFVIAKESPTAIQTSIGFALRPDRFIEEDPFYSQILLGVTQESQKQGVNITFIKGENLAENEDFSKRYSVLSKLSGLIVAGQMPEAFLNYLQQIRIPCVFLNYHSSAYPYDAVASDQRQVGRILGRHLAGLGHRNCLYLSGEANNVAYQERLAGFKEIFAAQNGRTVHVFEGGKHSQDGREMIRKALSQNVSFSAVAAGNDMIAIGALNELLDRGLSVPNQISVCGIDNSSPAENCRPGLTTVHIEKSEMGARAVRLILQRITDPGRINETILFGVRLVYRQSTAIAPE